MLKKGVFGQALINGDIVYKAVADAFGMPYTEVSKYVG